MQALSGHGLAGGEDFRPGVVHRLDKDTSGLLVVAKSVEAHRRLVAMMRRRAVDRRYLALVHGSFAADSGTIEAPVGRDPVKRKSMTVGGLAAREATTHFRVLERLGDFTLVEARLETGRTHQIRVHFAAIGHPVAGDPTYARRDPLGIGAAVPAQLPAGVSRIRSPGKTSSSRLRCRPISHVVARPGCAKAEGAGESDAVSIGQRRSPSSISTALWSSARPRCCW